MHISNQVQTSSSLRASPENQTDLAQSEQQTGDQKEADKQELPSYEVRSRQANLERERFFSVLDKTGKASVDDDTSANAGTEVDKPSTSAAEGSVVRKRASRARKEDSASQAAGPSETSASSSEGHESNANFATRILDKFVNNAGKVFVSGLALSAGFGVVRNLGPLLGGVSFRGQGNGQTLQDAQYTVMQEKVPLPNFDSPIIHRPVNERLLQDAQHAVLERFGSYIPAYAHCYEVDAKISEDIPSNMEAVYYPDSNRIRLSPSRLSHYQANALLHIAMHEYCHCFTHPVLRDALSHSPLQEDLHESLTEQILRSGGGNNSYKPKYEVWIRTRGREAQKLEEAVGEATLMRAYFSGHKDAISKISRAAVDIYPKKVTLAAWFAIETRGALEKEDEGKLAECYVGASLLAEGKLPREKEYFSYDYSVADMFLPVRHFSDINSKQQEVMLEQAKQARDRLGAKFDQAFYNFDLEAADLAMRAVREDLVANWQPVTFEEQPEDRFDEIEGQMEDLHEMENKRL